jgi:hypothetical protein
MKEGTFLERNSALLLKAVLWVASVSLSVVVTFIGYGWRLSAMETQARETKNEVQATRGEVQATRVEVSELKGMFQEHVRFSSRTSASAVQLAH